MLLDGRWSRKWEKCRHCGRTDRPHEANGYCSTCSSYWSNPDRARAARKKRRIEQDLTAKEYPRVRQWHIDNAEKVKQYKKEWHAKNGEKPKWTVGMTVWVEAGKLGWVKGTIVDRPNRSAIWVQCKGFKTKVRGDKLRTENPNAPKMTYPAGYLSFLEPEKRATILGDVSR